MALSSNGKITIFGDPNEPNSSIVFKHSNIAGNQKEKTAPNPENTNGILFYDKEGLIKKIDFLEENKGKFLKISDSEPLNLVFVDSNEGNVASASVLQTSRDIGGVAFDGSENIDLPGVNIDGTVNTSGNAATATKLKNNKTIGGVDFNGLSNIDLPGVNETGNQDTSGNAATATTAISIKDVNASATELNLLDGGTDVGESITISDADGFIIKVGENMKTIPASDIKTYATSGIDIIGLDVKKSVRVTTT